MKQSRLHEHHQKLGAIFEEVAGWEMPARYGEWVAEYHAVRQAVGRPAFQAEHVAAGRTGQAGMEA